MDDLEVERLKASVAEQLDPAQCLELSELLRRLARARRGDIAIERRTQMVLENRRGSSCGHTDVVKHGRAGNGRQRFRCRSKLTEDGEVLACELFDTLIHTYLPNPPHTPEVP
ncbi:IS1/IS1595 family N-terminal zinc-binding domain-containing protein [Rhizobium yanglingense]